MTQYITSAQDSETFNQDIDIRRTELANQRWNRSKSQALATNEGIDLNDDHWAVIVFLRKYYLNHGLPRAARTTARVLNKHFSKLGGSQYLHRLFYDGPVTQGSRLACLRNPANATDLSFGSSY